MKVCAIVLEYRAAKKTLTCLQSLAHQGIDTVVLVDNSDDAQASRELAQVVQEIRKAAYGYELHLLIPGSNLGFAGGVNFAINHACTSNCDAFLLLNNDAVLTPGSGAHLIAALNNRTADLIAPVITDDHGEKQPMLYYQRFFGFLTHRHLFGSFPYLSGCCLLFGRDLLDDGKLFDEDFFMYGEDTLLGWRVMQEKRKAREVSEATVRHSGQDSRRPSSLFYEYHMARAHLLLATKTARNSAEIPVLLCTKFLGLLLRALRRSIRYRSLLPIHAMTLSWCRLAIRKA